MGALLHIEGGHNPIHIHAIFCSAKGSPTLPPHEMSTAGARARAIIGVFIFELMSEVA
jgi:hypothetical protein